MIKIKILINLFHSNFNPLPCCFQRYFLLPAMNDTARSNFINYTQIISIISYTMFIYSKIFAWTGETAPSVPERVYYNRDQGTIESYFTKSNQIFDKNNSPLIFTAQISQATDILQKYLVPGKEQHFLLIGPHGSAKRYVRKIKDSVKYINVFTVL